MPARVNDGTTFRLLGGLRKLGVRPLPLVCYPNPAGKTTRVGRRLRFALGVTRTARGVDQDAPLLPGDGQDRGKVLWIQGGPCGGLVERKTVSGAPLILAIPGVQGDQVSQLSSLRVATQVIGKDRSYGILPANEVCRHMW